MALKSKDLRELRVFVKEEGRRPKACTLEVPYGAAHADLRTAVSQVVLGPEDERWSKVHEHTQEDLDPQHGGGKVAVTTKYEAHELKLWAHPHDDCCPLRHVELNNSPPEMDVYALLAGATAPHLSPLDSEPAQRAWWASLPRGRNALRACAEQRLAAKACVPPVAALPVLQRKIVSTAEKVDPRASNEAGGGSGEPASVEAGAGDTSGEGPQGGEQQPPPAQPPPLPPPEAPGPARDNTAPVVPLGNERSAEDKGRKAGASPKRAASGAAGAKAPPAEAAEAAGAEVAKEAVEEAKQTELVVGDVQRENEEMEVVMVEMEVPWNLRHDLMLESMQGLWEMATRDRPYPVSFSHSSLAVLVRGLESGALEVMSVAAAAVWVVAAKAEQRAMLVQLGAVEALAGAALIGHKEREHLCRTKQDAAVVEAAAKNDAALAAEEAAERAEVAAQKAIKWASRGIGGAAAEVAKDEAIANAAAAKLEAAAVRAGADAAAAEAAALTAAAAAAVAAPPQGVGAEAGEGGAQCPLQGGDVDVVEWNSDKRALLLLCNRVVYHCLGALGVMAVDPKARATALQVSPTLNFLTQLAQAEFPPPPHISPPPPNPEPSQHPEQHPNGAPSAEPDPQVDAPADAKQAGAQSKKGAAQGQKDKKGAAEGKQVKEVAHKGTAAAEGEAGLQGGAAEAPPEGGKGADAAAAGGAVGDGGVGEGAHDGNGEGGGGADGVPEEPEGLMPEDDVGVHQKMAVEVLYSMLGRDRDVRASLARHGGLKDLLTLSRADSGDVRSVALLCLNAYARDAAPPAHTAGHDLMGQSRQALDVVHGLLGALDELLDMHGDMDPDQHFLGLEQHPLLVVVEIAASALWGAVAAQVAAERTAWERDGDESSVGSRRHSVEGSESHSPVLTYDDTSLLARAAGRLVALLQDMEALQQEQDNIPMAEASQEQLYHMRSVISNHAFGGQYGNRSSASCTAVSLFCVMSSIALVHSTPVLTARAHMHVTRLHIDLQQLQMGTEQAKEVLDGHVAGMISKRSTSRFYIDDDDDLQRANELEQALLDAHKEVHNMQMRIEDVEEALQGGCEECLAAAQDAMRLRLQLVLHTKSVGEAAPPPDPPAPQSEDGSLLDGVPEGSQLSGSSASSHAGSTHSDGDQHDLVGLVHLAAASLVTALAQTAHPALKATAVDPGPVFLGPFRPLLRSNGVLKDLLGLVTACDICTGGPVHTLAAAPTTSFHAPGVGSGGGPPAAQGEGPGAAADADTGALSRTGSRAPTRPTSASTHRSDANPTRPSSAMTHTSVGLQSRKLAMAPATQHAGSSQAGDGHTPTDDCAAAAAAGAAAPDGIHGPNASAAEGIGQQGEFGVPPTINNPPPLTPIAVATRLVVASGVVHLLACDAPVGQFQLQQLLAYMQHQSATATAGSATLAARIARVEHELQDDEVLLMSHHPDEHGGLDADTDSSHNLATHALPEAAHRLRDLRFARAGCEALFPFLAACMWCLCRHESSRKGLLVGDSEAWVNLLEGWLTSGLSVVNHHHRIVHPNPDGFYTRPSHLNTHQPDATHPAGSGPAAKGGAEDTEMEEAEEQPRMFASLGCSSQWGFSSTSSEQQSQSESGGLHALNGTPHGPASNAHDAGGGSGGFAPYGLATLAFAARSGHSAIAASRQVRNSLMSLWLLMRQWLTENLSPMNLLRSCDGLTVVGGASWWQLPLSINTPLPLSGGMSKGLYALMEAATSLPDNKGTDAGALREMSMRCCWSLSVAHPVVEERLVSLGSALLALATAISPTASSPLRVVALNHVLSLTPTPAHVEAMGGLRQVAGLLADVVDKALESADAAGRGADLATLEAATRGIARLALSSKGRQALRRCGCIARLVRIAHADNVALEEVATKRVQEGIPDWERAEELVAPLRAINNAMPTQPTAAQQHLEATMQVDSSTPTSWGAESGGLGWEGTHLLPSEFPPLPAETRRSAAEVAAAARAAAGLAPDLHEGPDGGEGGHTHSHHEHGGACSHAHGVTAGGEDEVGGDADIGLLSLWGLLNMSNYEPAQVSICRHGLYTLLRMVHRSVDPRRRSAAAAILTNIHFNPGNATTLYKAEIKLKFAALLRLRGLHQAASKAKLQQLPFGIEPDSLKAKALAKSIASKSSPHKQQGEEGNPLASLAHGNSLREGPKGKGSARMLASIHLDKGLKQMQAAMAKDQASETEEEAAPPKNPYLAGGRDDEQSESGSVVEDPAALEAKLAFLRWVVEPGVHVLGDQQPAVEALHMGDLGAGAGVTQADLVSKLTSDPEEEAWLAYVRSIAAMDNFEQTRLVQGEFLRGSLSRSLAEGAQSLWQNRIVRAPAAVSPAALASPRASLTLTRPATAARAISSSTRTARAPAAGGDAKAAPGSAGSPLKAPSPLPTSSGGAGGGAVAHSPSGGPGLLGRSQGLQESAEPALAPPSPAARPATAQPSSRRAAGSAGSSSGKAASRGHAWGNGVAKNRGVAHAGNTSSSSSSSSRVLGAVARTKPRPAAPPPARPSTAPAAAARQGKVASLRYEAESTTMWSPHVKSYMQESNTKGDKAALLAKRLLRTSIPTPTTNTLANLADEIFENKTVKEGRRAAEEAAAVEAAARRAAQEEEEAERLREAGIAEELRVIDLTRFDSIRSLDRRRSSIGRKRQSSFGSALKSEDSGDDAGSRSRRRMSRSMSRALSVAVVRASMRGEARAADRAAEYAAKAADAAAAARLPVRRAVSRSSSRRSVLFDSGSTRRTSISSVASDSGWPQGNGGYGPAAGGQGRPSDASVAAVPGAVGGPKQPAHMSAMKKLSLSGAMAGEDEESRKARNITRGHRQTTVRFGDGGSSSDESDIPALSKPDQDPQQHVDPQQQEGAQFGVSTGEAPGSSSQRGTSARPSRAECAAERALAEVDPQASRKLALSPNHPARGSASFVATSLVQIGALSSMSPAASPRQPRREKSDSLRNSLRHNSSRTHTPRDQQQAGGGIAAEQTTISEGAEEVEAEPQDMLGPHVRAALQGPTNTAPYHLPYRGSTRPPGQTLMSLKRDMGHEAWEAVAFPDRAAKRAERLANRCTLANHVPKPTTVLSVEATEFTALKHAEQKLKDMMASDGDSGPNYDYEQVEREAREKREKVQAELPLAVRLATGDGGPDRIYHFSHQLGYNPRHLVMFEHVEGATFCESLYGHYLLPNGKLAHFALGDTVRKGHKVDLAAPPAIPFSAVDWLHACRGPLPTTRAFTDWSLPGARRTAGLLCPLWCPVPTLGPTAPTTMEGGLPVLQWKDLSSPVKWHEANVPAEHDKAPMLVLRSICITATLHRVTRVTVETTTVPPKPKVVQKKKKRPAGPARPAAGRGTARR